MTARILLVDDEPCLCRALERALRNFGYEVVTAADAYSAYDLLAESAFDLVLLDLRMPQLAGDAFYLAIARRWTRLRNRVILMSGDIWTLEADWPAELRRCPVLAKPFTLEALRAAVKLVLAEADVEEHARQRQGNGG